MEKKFKNFFLLWNRIKAWFWWHFKATEAEKAQIDWYIYGHSFIKNGKRINPEKFFKSYNK